MEVQQAAAAAAANDRISDRKGRHYRDLFQHVKTALQPQDETPTDHEAEDADDDV
jgi:hypothetical protein